MDLNHSNYKEYQFPKDFVWGVAAGSYQIEGGWLEGNKDESIWDRFVHTPGHIKDGTTGDVACDFYHRYREDIDMMANLGIKNFIYTISWPRVIKDGIGEINPEGIKFYRDVLTCLREHGIKSWMVLYHWDLPQCLQDKGGWQNREIVNWFEYYAKTMYRELGDLVDNWIPILEPYAISFCAYWLQMFPPAIKDYSALLQVNHHINLAHGVAVRAFRESGLRGKVGIKMSMNMAYPLDPNNPKDVYAAHLRNMEEHQMFCDPIMKGEYPEELFEYLQKQGIKLPDIQPGDMELMSPELDFLGINNYYGEYVTYDESRWPLPYRLVKTGKQKTPKNWEFCPDAFYDIIKWANDSYHPNEIIITENGCASNDWVDDEGKCEDPNRVCYLKNYLKRVAKAIDDGIPVTGYFVWSFWDNFEWADGLTVRFGLVHVNYKTLKRTPKSSAYWFSDVVRNNGFTALKIEAEQS